MCAYCNITDPTGALIPHEVKVDGTKQDYEVSILEDVEYEQISLIIDGTYSDIRIKINFCPMCGNQLIW